MNDGGVGLVVLVCTTPHLATRVAGPEEEEGARVHLAARTHTTSIN